MKKLFLAALGVGLLVVPVRAYACGTEKSTSAEVRSLTLAEFKQVQPKATVVDVNNSATRTKLGIIPGAILLTSASRFAVNELPVNKASKLVFYCSSTQCDASHSAAKRAVDVGYTDVSVLPAGIKGWIEAGNPVAHSNS